MRWQILPGRANYGSNGIFDRDTITRGQEDKDVDTELLRNAILRRRLELPNEAWLPARRELASEQDMSPERFDLTYPWAADHWRICKKPAVLTSSSLLPHLMNGPSIVIGVLLSALILQTVAIGRPSLWLDEAASVEVAKTAWPSFLQAISKDSNQVLYYLLLRVWIQLFGDSEAASRSLSVIFSVATIPSLYLFAKRLFDTRIAVLSILFFCANCLTVRYAQEARSYSLLTFFTVNSWLFFTKTIDLKSPTNVLGYIITTAIGPYVHLFAIFTIPAQLLSLMAGGKRDAHWRRIFLYMLLSTIACSPIVLLIIKNNIGQTSWIQSLSFASLRQLVGDLCGLSDQGHVAHVLTLAYLAAVFAGIATVLSDLCERNEAARGYFMVVAGALLPIIFTIAISIVEPMMVSRYLIETVPFLGILAAVGIVRAGRYFSLPCAIVLLFLLLFQSVKYDQNKRQDWDAATVYVVTHSQPGDGVIFFIPMCRWPFDYYRSRIQNVSQWPAVIFPAWNSSFLVDGNYPVVSLRDRKTSESLEKAITTAGQQYSRIWLMLCGAQPSSNGALGLRNWITAALEKDRSTVPVPDFAAVGIILYTSSNPSPRNKAAVLH